MDDGQGGGDEARRGTPQGRVLVPSVLHALDLIEYLAEHGATKVAALLGALGVARSSLYNILATLEERGYVTVSRGTVRLGVKVLNLSNAVLASLELRGVARPALEGLVAATEETANLGVLSGAAVVYIDIVSTTLPVRLSSEVGRTCPLYCTALGKVLLAYADERTYRRLVEGIGWQRYTPHTVRGPDELAAACRQVRERGWALDDEEFDEGVRCLAIPLRDHRGTVVAALSLSGPEYRLPERRWPELLRPLLAAAAEIEAALGWPGPGRTPETAPGLDPRPTT